MGESVTDASTDRDAPTLPMDPVTPADAPTLPPAEADPVRAGTVPPIGTKVRYFGDYELLEEIARGGMGVVYKARQTSLNRIVALKMILTGQLANEVEIRRFHAEADAAAHLEHPHIVPVYDVGSTDEFPCYIVSKYVEGTDLAIRLKQSRLKHTEAAELVATVAEALHYAHKQGLVHRDVKTGNILVGKDGKPL